MAKPAEIYDLLLDVATVDDALIEDFIIGLTWTYCRSTSVGLCMTAESRSRTFEWPGSLKGQTVKKLANWILSWDSMKSSIAMAAINSVLNVGKLRNSQLLPVTSPASANLAVFDYFLPAIKNKNSVVIGHYPGIERFQEQCALKVIELNPVSNDYPANACEYLLPEAEWVFLTGTSIANKTFPRLLELSKNANVVLMGPSVPWLSELSEFGVDFLAGVVVQDETRLFQTIAEGGGVNIFSHTAVQYEICDLGKSRMNTTQEKIMNIISQRESLKEEMQNWYKYPGKGSYPRAYELVSLDEELSLLDSQYKQMWDLRNSFAK